MKKKLLIAGSIGTMMVIIAVLVKKLDALQKEYAEFIYSSRYGYDI